ncbi:nitric oxide synthase 1-like protein [Corchorus olitorius]|uniref:Nitric oxide synthase 1-like protein n=1 Tax=Corchorus olitorius TaxID=93759 RepID=A0A1R3JTT2_9ROSI|nr:nitric oxide synthase 1-like protein [Corchorus olitorius]
MALKTLSTFLSPLSLPNNHYLTKFSPNRMEPARLLRPEETCSSKGNRLTRLLSL